jgi:lipopolysaccharide export system protein LptC
VKRIPAARLFPLVLMLVLALITFYIERTVNVDEANPSAARHDPDYLLSGFSTVTYNREGRPITSLSAAKMLHYPDDDSTELLAPRVVQSRPAEPRLTVTAERGVLSSKGDEIFLYDNVVLQRDAHLARPAARVTTEFLHVVRERSLVRTDRKVLIEQEGRSISGRGMEYHNDSAEFLLRDEVQATFRAP